MTGPGDRSGRDDAEQGASAPGGGFGKGAFGVSGSGDTSGFGGLVRVEPGGAVALHSTDRPYGGYFDEVTDAILKLHHKIMNEPLGPKRARQLAREQEEGTAKDLMVEMPSTVRADKKLRKAYEEAAAEGRTGQFLIEQRDGNAVLPPEERPQGLGKAWR